MLKKKKHHLYVTIGFIGCRFYQALFNSIVSFYYE